VIGKLPKQSNENLILKVTCRSEDIFHWVGKIRDDAK
jgi:hypothetical protein